MVGSTVNGSDALWETGQPDDNLGEDCGSLYQTYDYKLNDLDCSLRYGGICQLPHE